MRTRRFLVIGLAALVVVAAPIASTAKKKVKDKTPPRMSFAPFNNLSGNPPIKFSHVPTVGQPPLFGPVTDASSGVKSVRVTFTPCVQPPVATATTDCTMPTTVEAVDNALHTPGSPARFLCDDGKLARRCTWEAAVPLGPGTYLVTGYAKDKVGNRGNLPATKVLII